ncbi:5-formyltetrahydrofolate cyclo-ligase [Xanthobacter sp. TB0139]|uniref:5-formyltetrahydrofolate cyclo-ligase n=1 Tax=Xanthobacter sp. TB0139 TaxID=3459178 RepID=UPI004039524B
MTDSLSPDPRSSVSAAYMRAEKGRMRQVALARRSAMGEAARAEAGQRAAHLACREILRGPARHVALFASIRDEIDPRPLAALLRAQGVQLALPVVVGADMPLLFRHWAENDPLTPQGRYAIPTPAPDAPEVSPDVVMVPLAVFDGQGFRIGYGGGFYDRTLAGLRAIGPLRAMGYAFACQQTEQVPHEPHDEPMDMMITENGVLPCASPCVLPGAPLSRPVG